MRTSRIPGFHRLPLGERVRLVGEAAGFDEGELEDLSRPDPVPIELAEALSENVVGVFPLPLGVAVNFRVNGRDRLVPMAIEESSVVAAASNAARHLREGPGIEVEVDRPIQAGQIQVLDVSDLEAAAAAVRAAEAELLAEGDRGHERLVAAGGGARSVEARTYPDTPIGPMLIVQIAVDVADAMGANAVDSICEALGPRIAALTGGRVRLRILSNLCERRLVRAFGRVSAGAMSGDEARGVVEASVFASVDPHRAVTHNKGILNGVDALVLATGNDWRSVEAAAHAFAARSGTYRPLSTWNFEGGSLEGRLEMPMPVGTVGGATWAHPQAARALRIAGASRGRDLAELAAAVGLAQNLAALRALASEGIQAGHMALHARKVAIEAGATAGPPLHPGSGTG